MKILSRVNLNRSEDLGINGGALCRSIAKLFAKISIPKFSLTRAWIQIPIIFAALHIGLAHAGRPANVSAGEIALLPPFCIDTEGFVHGPKNSPTQSPRAPMWESRMGYSFWAMHHYCWGLVMLNRLRLGRAETNNKSVYARQIVNEYFYVIEHSTPDFVMLPEIWTRIGEASLLAGDIGGAMDAYAKARRLKPDYAPAYIQWAEFRMRNNHRDEALALIEEGLKFSPDSSALLELRGKLTTNEGAAPANTRANARLKTPIGGASAASSP